MGYIIEDRIIFLQWIFKGMLKKIFKVTFNVVYERYIMRYIKNISGMNI